MRTRREVARARPGGASVAGPPVSPDRPTTDNGLVGLALSGGGMRSASFNLGVLRALNARGMLVHVDYLSTVSGGGWIGSALQSLVRSPLAPFPFEATAATAKEPPSESAALQHLRNESASMLPSGLAGRLLVAALIVRGQIATAALLLPLAVLLAIATGPLVIDSIDRHSAAALAVDPTWEGPLQWSWFLRLSPLAFKVALGWLLFGYVVAVFARPRIKRRQALEKSYTAALWGTLLIALIEVQPVVIAHWGNLVLGADRSGHISSLKWQFVAAAASLLSIGPLSAVLPKVTRPLGLALAFLVSALLPYAVYLTLVAKLTHTWALNPHSTSIMSDWRAAVTPWAELSALAFAMFCLFDMNVVSLHGLFRDRLLRVFVLKPLDKGYEADEDLRLSQIADEVSWAPYPIMNAALNLQSSRDPTLRGRGCDFFIFSPYFVGSDRTGYCDTKVVEYAVPGMSLGTAMAVSAAAASPNMGTYTLPATVFLMTFFNLRMGYWMPHPARLAEWAIKRRIDPKWASLGAPGLRQRLDWFRWYPKFTAFVREMASGIDDQSDMVFLSDGGHIENTGAYELLRRRCRVVIVSDAEEDPRMHFGGLAALVRYARINLQTEITLDVGALRLGDARGSTKHAVVGTIRYPEIDGRAETATLLYVKLSMTGDEDELIREYRCRNADFPHESTADQLFDEAQFEAYQSLGRHCLDGLFPKDFRAASERPLEAWLHAPEGHSEGMKSGTRPEPNGTND